MASKKPAVAQNGTTTSPKNDIAKLINETSQWVQTPIESDDELDRRIGEYFNLCVSKGELPIFETMSLYLGVSDDEALRWVSGDGCSNKRKRLMQVALTRMKAIEGKAMYANMLPYVPSIWRSKQYFGYREPTSELKLINDTSPLKELPSAEGVAKAYLEDIEQGEEE